MLTLRLFGCAARILLPGMAFYTLLLKQWTHRMIQINSWMVLFNLPTFGKPEPIDAVFVFEENITSAEATNELELFCKHTVIKIFPLENVNVTKG